MKKTSKIIALLLSFMLAATSISFADTLPADSLVGQQVNTNDVVNDQTDLDNEGDEPQGDEPDEPVVVEDEVVKSVSVKNVNKKFTFMKTVAFTTSVPKQEKYEIEDEWWRGTDGSEIYKGSSRKAKSGKLSYSYFVELSAMDGYKFDKSTRITVNGKKSKVVPVIRDEGKTAIFRKVITGVTTDNYVVLPKGVRQKGQERVSINNVTQKIILGGCRKSTITFVKGKHTIDTSIIVPNNTTIKAKGATITQKTPGKPIFVNYLYKKSKYNKGKLKKKGKYNRCYNS